MLSVCSLSFSISATASDSLCIWCLIEFRQQQQQQLHYYGPRRLCVSVLLFVIILHFSSSCKDTALCFSVINEEDFKETVVKLHLPSTSLLLTRRHKHWPKLYWRWWTSSFTLQLWPRWLVTCQLRPMGRQRHWQLCGQQVHDWAELKHLPAARWFSDSLEMET